MKVHEINDFFDALKLVCGIVNYEFEVSDGIVIVKPREVKP